MPSDKVKAPAFQFYPKDFLADSHVMAMRLPERGAYITLLCSCWIDGSLPMDLDALARRCQVSPAVFARLWPALEPCFRVSPDAPTRLIQPRIERERKKQDTYRTMKAEAGQKGGRAKAENKQNASKRPSKQLAKASPPSSSSSSSSSSVSDLLSSDFGQESTRAHEATDVERIRRFIDSYRDLHAQYVGVSYLGNPTTDYREACTLVETYDDEMLEKLTVYWLNDRDKFATDGTRTVAKFRSRVSKYAEELKAKRLA